MGLHSEKILDAGVDVVGGAEDLSCTLLAVNRKNALWGHHRNHFTGKNEGDTRLPAKCSCLDGTDVEYHGKWEYCSARQTHVPNNALELVLVHESFDGQKGAEREILQF